MQKYQIVCKACNTVHGVIDNPGTAGVAPKCSECGMVRIAVEPVMEEQVSSQEFDLFISNKRTAINKHHGFQLNIVELTGKSEQAIKNLFIERAAEALGDLLKNPENLANLLEAKNK